MALLQKLTLLQAQQIATPESEFSAFSGVFNKKNLRKMARFIAMSAYVENPDWYVALTADQITTVKKIYNLLNLTFNGIKRSTDYVTLEKELNNLGLEFERGEIRNVYFNLIENGKVSFFSFLVAISKPIFAGDLFQADKNMTDPNNRTSKYRERERIVKSAISMFKAFLSPDFYLNLKHPSNDQGIKRVYDFKRLKGCGSSDCSEDDLSVASELNGEFYNKSLDQLNSSFSKSIARQNNSELMKKELTEKTAYKKESIRDTINKLLVKTSDPIKVFSKPPIKPQLTVSLKGSLQKPSKSIRNNDAPIKPPAVLIKELKLPRSSSHRRRIRSHSRSHSKGSPKVFRRQSSSPAKYPTSSKVLTTIVQRDNLALSSLKFKNLLNSSSANQLPNTGESNPLNYSPLNYIYSANSSPVYTPPINTTPNNTTGSNTPISALFKPKTVPNNLLATEEPVAISAALSSSYKFPNFQKRKEAMNTALGIISPPNAASQKYIPYPKNAMLDKSNFSSALKVANYYRNPLHVTPEPFKVSAENSIKQTKVLASPLRKDVPPTSRSMPHTITARRKKYKAVQLK